MMEGEEGRGGGRGLGMRKICRISKIAQMIFVVINVNVVVHEDAEGAYL